MSYNKCPGERCTKLRIQSLDIWMLTALLVCVRVCRWWTRVRCWGVKCTTEPASCCTRVSSCTHPHARQHKPSFCRCGMVLYSRACRNCKHGSQKNLTESTVCLIMHFGLLHLDAVLIQFWTYTSVLHSGKMSTTCRTVNACFLAPHLFSLLAQVTTIRVSFHGKGFTLASVEAWC